MNKGFRKPLPILLALMAMPAEDAAANPIEPLAPLEGHSRVLSLTGRVVSEKGGVSCKSPEAALAGLEMLQRGGNAVDAIVASGLASTVTSAGMRTIAGYGGAMVVYLKKLGKPVVVDFNSYAPLDLNASMFANQAETNDAASVKTVLPWSPVAGLHTALKNYGTMTWAEVLQPAIRLAEQGYVLSAAGASAINNNCAPGKKFRLSPASPASYCPDPLHRRAGTEDGRLPSVHRQRHHHEGPHGLAESPRQAAGAGACEVPRP
jgi:gamma-glutamyltranspeptidase